MANGFPALPVIPPEQRTPVVEALLATLHAQQDRLAELEQTVQQLRDEIAVLKGQKPRPQIAPSRLEQPTTSPPLPSGGQKETPGIREKAQERSAYRYPRTTHRLPPSSARLGV